LAGGWAAGCLVGRWAEMVNGIAARSGNVSKVATRDRFTFLASLVVINGGGSKQEIHELQHLDPFLILIWRPVLKFSQVFELGVLE
jgi:hypothetical protein